MTDLQNTPGLSDSTDTAIDYSTCYAPLSHGSLFSGIGGFDLASEWMGWKNEFHCEWNDFGKQVLQYYWPKAKSYDDITKTDFTIWRGKIDILTGGFPCQPYSVAGKRKGTEDDRHLWPEMLRAVREIQPSWIVGENVSGLINWSGGLVFEEVQTDLENEGYEVWANVLPAASVNAPHKRDRVWFVAFNAKCKPNGGHNTRKGEGARMEMERNELGKTGWNEGADNIKPSSFNDANASSERCNHRGDNRQERQVCNNENRNAKEDKPKRNGRKRGISETGEIGNAANSNSSRLQKTGTEQQATGIEQYGELDGTFMYPNCPSEQREHFKRPWKREFNRSDSFKKIDDWEKFPTQAPICDGDDGLSSRLDAITFPKWRTESVKGGGNAIVPQVAFQIFKAINEFRSSGA